LYDNIKLKKENRGFNIHAKKVLMCKGKSTELIIQCKDIPVNNIIGSGYQNYCKDNDSFFLK